MVGAGRPSKVAERREQIVWALYELLTESNFDDVTVKTIAQRAEVAPGLVHHYFDNKDSIYGELATAMLE
ncbi:MAG: TetR family transcriptional regulator, partial [Acidimicrobiales bacterium]